jgi:NAD(P)-dependent dehydrogenase (short-subunit alcohol dehydrogenase family)
VDLQLEGKRAIVTGGSRGIGKAIARALAAEGVDVVIAARDVERLKAAADELAGASGRQVIPVVADTADDEAVRALVATTVDRLGGVDILVNNAATPGSVAPPGPLSSLRDEDVLADLDVKVLGYLRTARAVAPHLVDQGWGRIINISGLAARSAGRIAGSIRNVSVAALTKNLADELGPHGVNVTVVHPGLTRTERTGRHLPDRQFNSVGRVIEADEVAAVVTFLASPVSVAINGDAIAAGGGTPGPIFY